MGTYELEETKKTYSKEEVEEIRRKWRAEQEQRLKLSTVPLIESVEVIRKDKTLSEIGIPTRNELLERGFLKYNTFCELALTNSAIDEIKKQAKNGGIDVEKKSTRFCKGCVDDFYNGKNDIGVEKCWSLENARPVYKKFVPSDKTPPYDTENYTLTYSCHRKKGMVCIHTLDHYEKNGLN